MKCKVCGCEMVEIIDASSGITYNVCRRSMAETVFDLVESGTVTLKDQSPVSGLKVVRGSDDADKNESRGRNSRRVNAIE